MNLGFVLTKQTEKITMQIVLQTIDIVLLELKRRFEGNQTFIFSCLYIIPYIMASSPNGGIILKIFSNFTKMTLKIQAYLQ